MRDQRNKTIILLFVACAAVLSLFSFDRVLGPSRHFHFLDLANSFLNGRLDTDTPRRYRNQTPRENDPRGLQDAVNRHLTEGEKGVGWNDWASIRVITVKDGDERFVVKGVFPWSDAQGDAKKKFRTVDGVEMVISDEDIARDCPPPSGRCDETKYYVSFPPFPAIAMMPLFLIWGYDTNDVLFTILLAALNAVLLFLLFEHLRERGLSNRSTRENVFLTILFTFGTVNFFSSIRGEVWFTALILGVTLHVSYILLAIEARHPFWAGTMMGLGMATRTPIAFAFPFFVLELLRDGERLRWPGVRPFMKKGVLFAIPVLVIGIALMVYNYARFENVFEFGHTFLQGGTRPSIREHGLMSWWFLKNNLAAAITNPPVIDTFPPFIHITRHGLSIFFCTPALLWILWPKTFGAFARNALVAMFIVSLPDLFYQNTGWAQFGYRFALDFMPYMFILLAVCGQRFSGRAWWVAVALSFVMNALGAITFDRMGMFYYD